jgi:hypothetical protein
MFEKRAVSKVDQNTGSFSEYNRGLDHCDDLIIWTGCCKIDTLRGGNNPGLSFSVF